MIDTMLQEVDAQLPDALSPIAAKRLAQLITRAWWSYATLFILRFAYRALQNDIGLGEVGTIAINLASALIYCFFCCAIWSLVRHIRSLITTPLRRWVVISIRLFLLAIVLLFVAKLLGALSLVLISLSFFAGLMLTSYFVGNLALICGVPGIMMLACTAHRQLLGEDNFERYRTFFLATIVTLVVSLIAMITLAVLILVIDPSQPATLDSKTVVALLGYLTKAPAIAAVWSLLLLIPIRRKLLRVAEGQLCPNCNYDLRGNPADGCPECGWGRADAVETVAIGPVESED